MKRYTKSRKSECRNENKIDLNDFFGTWEDEKESDVIIDEIREARVEKDECRNL